MDDFNIVPAKTSDLSLYFETDPFNNYPGYFKIQKDAETGLYFNPSAEKPFIVDIRTNWDKSDTVHCASVEEVLELNSRISSVSQPFEKEVLSDLLNGSITQNMQHAQEMYKRATELISKTQPLSGLVSELSSLTPQLEDSRKRLDSAATKADAMRKVVEKIEAKIDSQKPSWFQLNFPITKQAREICAQSEKAALDLIAKRKGLFKLDCQVRSLSSEVNHLSDSIKHLNDKISKIAPAAQELAALTTTDKDITYTKLFCVCRNYERTSFTQNQIQQSKDTATLCLRQIHNLIPAKESISERLNQAKDSINHMAPSLKPIAPNKANQMAV